MKKKILTVIPDTVYVANLLSALKDERLTIQPAFSAKEAESLLEKETFDLLITEVSLEYEDSGLILIHDARKKYPEMKIILDTKMELTDGLDFDRTGETGEGWIAADRIISRKNRFFQLKQAIQDFFPEIS